MVKKSPKDTQSRCWSVTIPAQPDDVDLDAVKEMGGELSDVAFTREEIVEVVEEYKGFRAQMEVAESGYVHWQGILYAKSPVRFSTLKRKFPNQWHMESARSQEGYSRQFVPFSFFPYVQDVTLVAYTSIASAMSCPITLRRATTAPTLLLAQADEVRAGASRAPRTQSVGRCEATLGHKEAD